MAYRKLYKIAKHTDIRIDLGVLKSVGRIGSHKKPIAFTIRNLEKRDTLIPFDFAQGSIQKAHHELYLVINLLPITLYLTKLWFFRCSTLGISCVG